MLHFNAIKRLSSQRRDAFVLDAAFEAGDGITVLAGPSGAGKTTILKIIAGLLKPDAGRITLDDAVFFDSERSVDVAVQKRRVGFVLQNYALFPHFTALENVAYGARADTREERGSIAREMLAMMLIEHLAARRPEEMSGGEQQRVALARALASRPAIALLDEPLSAVDLKTRGKLLDEIERVQKSVKVPFIYVTHNESEAERIGDRRIDIDAGSIVETAD